MAFEGTWTPIVQRSVSCSLPARCLSCAWTPWSWIAFDLLGRQDTRQVRVLTEVLIVPAIVRVTNEVHARSEQHVMRESPCLLAEDSASLIVQLAVESRGHSRGGR